MLIKVGLCSIISPTQASKALLFARATATVDAIVPFEVPLTSVRFKYKWFVHPKLHQEISFWHPLPCHVLFQDCWGDYIVVYLDVFQHSTSKGLGHNMLFLCPLLVPFPCSFEGSRCFMHKTLAYLFLRICWMISSQHLPQFDREDLDSRLCMMFCHALVPLLCPFVRCRKNFTDEKPCPKLKAWLRVSPLRKKIHCHATNLVGFRTFSGEDYRFVHSSGFVERYLQKYYFHSCSFWLFLLNISSFEKYCKCWTSHFVVHICSFHLFLFVVLVLKAGVNRSCW